MNTKPTLPISDRQRLFQFRFSCRPTPKHPSFMKLQRVDFYVWIFDESVEQAAARANAFVSLFPYEHDENFTADEIIDELIASKQYPGLQLEAFVNAHRSGIHYQCVEKRNLFETFQGG